MTDLELYPDIDRTPSTLFASPDPAAIVAQATRIANEIAPLIREQRLVKRIGQSDHVFLEGWTLAGTMLGVFPITVSSGPILWEGEVLGYQATVEARTMAGQMVGRADAQCTHDENEKWKHAPSFQLRSMAITRASSKALRMPLGFVMHLAGYDATPAEEMEQAAARGETVTGGRGVQPGWKDLGEQQRGHADVAKTIDEHGLRSWIAEWIASKGYGPRPWAKGQLTQLRRAIEQEIHWREQSDPPESRPTPPGRDQGGSDPTSEAGERETAASAAGAPGRGSPSSPEADRHDPASDPSSPPEVSTRGTSGGGSMSPSDVRRGSLATGGDATSGVSVQDDLGPTVRGARPPSAPDPTSPSADPIDAQEAWGTAGQGGDANAGPAGQGDDGGSAGPASTDVTDNTHNTEDPRHPVVAWCEDHDVDIRQARIYLRKSFPAWFTDLRDWRDLAQLDADRVPRALAYLSAQFDQPEGGKA